MEDKKHILIVEDDEDYAEILEKGLQTSGFETHRAKNGREGLDKARTGRPDIILLDIMMPEMDGLAMLKALHGDTWGKSVPVILLSNVDSPETIESALGKGAFDYIVKAKWGVHEIAEHIKERLKCA